MNHRRHAQLARTLIDRCGGLDEAASACRLNVSRLSEFQRNGTGAFAPADVIADLEAYCGEAIYSGAMAACRPTAPVVSDALTETHEAVQAAADLLPLALAVQQGVPGAKAKFDDAVARLTKEVGDVEALTNANVTPIRGASQ